MSKIHNITPIKDSMTKEEAQEATKLFLQEVLTGNILKQEDIANREFTACGARGYHLITLKDNTSWVQGNKGIERLIGAHYLKNNMKLDNWTTVETKCFLRNENSQTIKCSIKNASKSPLKGMLAVQSNDFVSCSRYVGDKKPSTDPFSTPFDSFVKDKWTIQTETGYSDFTANANLRQQDDGTITIIDTEYGSFYNDGTTLSDETNMELSGAEFSFPINDILI